MKEEIQEKANYCLHCVVRPCQMSGCPLGNHIPDFIQAVKENNFEKAYEILSETTVLESICGRICPHEKRPRARSLLPEHSVPPGILLDWRKGATGERRVLTVELRTISVTASKVSALNPSRSLFPKTP